MDGFFPVATLLLQVCSVLAGRSRGQAISLVSDAIEDVDAGPDNQLRITDDQWLWDGTGIC